MQRNRIEIESRNNERAMNDENEDAKYDHPWSEEEWLAEFRRNDVRSAKFGELLETFGDDPDGDEKIRHEMGWDKNDDVERPWLDELLAEGDAAIDDDDPETWDDEKFERMAELAREMRDESDDDAEEQAAHTDNREDSPEDPDDDEPRRSWRRMRDVHDPDPDYGPLPTIPAYDLGMELAVDARKIAQDFPETSWKNADHYELFWQSLGTLTIPPAKMAGGHSYGYGTNICGNIACNRIGLEALEKSLAGFAELEAAGALPKAFREQIVPRAHELKRLILERIEAMRKRVWW
jgi:hypothetical protein